MPDDVIILTRRLNLISGVQRAMKVYSQFNQSKDLTEYDIYAFRFRQNSLGCLSDSVSILAMPDEVKEATPVPAPKSKPKPEKVKLNITFPL